MICVRFDLIQLCRIYHYYYMADIRQYWTLFKQYSHYHQKTEWTKYMYCQSLYDIFRQKTMLAELAWTDWTKPPVFPNKSIRQRKSIGIINRPAWAATRQPLFHITHSNASTKCISHSQAVNTYCLSHRHFRYLTYWKLAKYKYNRLLYNSKQ